VSSSHPPDSEPESSTEAKVEPSPDVVLIQGAEPDGNGLRVLRYRDQRLEAGAVRPLEHGKPIHGELVRLKPRRGLPLVCDVQVEMPAAHAVEPPEARSRTKGPSQVATDRYRKNWDRIWKQPRQLPN
jgi:hypothetical protein